MILGIDGYLGWPLALRLSAAGHKVSGMDNLFTRKAVQEVGSDSGLPILTMEERVRAAKELKGFRIKFYRGDITKYKKLYSVIKKEKPDTIIDFAEERSAPYSMCDHMHAAYAMQNNIVGTINLIYAVRELNANIRIIKMGTMGEYGTPNFDIPESPYMKALLDGKEDIITTPKWAGSWYHWTKVHDTNNLLLANKLWGLTVTNIMQGPVYGTRTKDITDQRLFTRFDFDETWGTVVNRYCAEAVLGIPLTVYGKGGQTRGFLSLEDSVEALRLLVENPAEKGAFRTVNQFRELFSVMQLAEYVQTAAKSAGIDAGIGHVDNPRVEKEEHYYNVERKVLPDLGFDKLKHNIREELVGMLMDLKEQRQRLEQYRSAIMPKTMWR